MCTCGVLFNNISLLVWVCFVFVQVRDKANESHYQMRLEPYHQRDSILFALAFVSPNAAGDKYYVIPEGEGVTATLTLRKNPIRANKFVFQLQKTAT